MKISYDDILSLPPKKLFAWLQSQIKVQIPEEIQTSEDLQYTAGLLTKLSSYYSYIMSLLTYAQLLVRETKRSQNKEAHEDMVDRRTILDNASKVISQQYQACSRCITCYTRHMDELKMLGCM